MKVVSVVVCVAADPQTQLPHLHTGATLLLMFMRVLHLVDALISGDVRNQRYNRTADMRASHHAYLKALLKATCLALAVG